MAFPWTAAGTGTDQELLDLTRAAIAQILATGQSYGINGRSLTRADLPTLTKYEQELSNRINSAAATGPAETLINFKRPQ